MYVICPFLSPINRTPPRTLFAIKSSHHRSSRLPLPLAQAAAPRAHLASQGASLEDGDFILPLPSTGGPPEVTTTGRIGAEKDRATTSPSRRLLEPVNPPVRIPMTPLCFALLCIGTRSPEIFLRPAPASSP
jgi:hypothetical protein